MTNEGKAAFDGAYFTIWLNKLSQQEYCEGM